jgi:uncharacterized protein (TIGR02145 family)
VDISEEKVYPTYTYNSDEGVITVAYPDGPTYKMEGFVVDKKYITFSTDETISGDGQDEPLRLNPLYFTGVYSPVDEYIDLTLGTTSAVGDKYDSGYRVLTKENVDTFGYLYSMEVMQKIQNALIAEGSQWRIPKKEDWDGLCNALECEDSNEDNETDRNHNSLDLTWLGIKAGTALKTTGWATENTSIDENSVAGRDICGFSVQPLGYVTNENVIIPSSARTDAAFWTFTEADNGFYGKLFNFNEGGVGQNIFTENAKLSIRLVKDYEPNNYNEYEYIFGDVYPTKVMRREESVCDENDKTNYKQIWLGVNLRLNTDEYNATIVDGWGDVTETIEKLSTVYVINEWDGFVWHKKAMTNGESVVIKSNEEGDCHEWRLVNGKLINITYEINEGFEQVKVETMQGFDNINKMVEGFSASTISELNILHEEITSLEKNINETIEEVSGNILSHVETEISSTIEYVDGLNNTMKTRVDDIENDYKERDADLEKKYKDDDVVVFNNAKAYADSLAVKYDAVGAAEIAEANAKAYADGLAKNYDATGAAATAEQNAKDYADGLAKNYDAAGAAAIAEHNAKVYADSLAVKYDAVGAAATAEAKAKAYADSLAKNYDAAGAAATAEANAKADAAKKYQLKGNYETAGAAAQALTDAKAYADVIQAYTDGAISVLNESFKNVLELKDRVDSIEQSNNFLDREITDLKADIENLRTEIEKLKTQINEIDSFVGGERLALTEFIQQTITKYINGTTEEISVVEKGNKLNIGFDEDAIFGDPEYK